MMIANDGFFFSFFFFFVQQIAQQWRSNLDPALLAATRRERLEWRASDAVRKMCTATGR
jgi:hypothetical protein